MPDTRWLFADQLGPHFVDSEDQRVLLVESVAAFGRRPMHRRKAHLILSALRHRAAALGERARLIRADTYREALDDVEGQVSVCAPTTWAARGLTDALAAEGRVSVLPARGWAIGEDQFAAWAGRRGSKRLLLEDFYRDVRRRHDVLIEADGEPAGGRWNYDEDNREAPPKDAALLHASASSAVDAQPWWPVEDEIDAQVRADLDAWQREGRIRLRGDDGPRRFAATRAEAVAALEHFVEHRLDGFGPHEDAMLSADDWMGHSLLSAPLNLGLLHPLEVARAAERAWREGRARLNSVEGFVRQVLGWREYVWHLYWHAGPDYRHANELGARQPLPAWFAELDAGGEVRMACLSDVLRRVREEGWTHHIPRLMVLGNWCLQRGYDPAAVTAWFRENFVDGYDWVMVPNVVGMSQHADGGWMATKPYAAGGAYVDRMSDYCGGCRYDPKVRVGERACPFTAGYWAFLERHRERFAGNHRMSRAVAGLGRLRDLDALVEQERLRGDAAP
ncbi:MAG: cryptochrome/photolyase family protein [Kineosporiaceae bacterium]